jgi:hypothetical protein
MLQLQVNVKEEDDHYTAGDFAFMPRYPSYGPVFFPQQQNP